jgi:hypothetical protein
MNRKIAFIFSLPLDKTKAGVDKRHLCYYFNMEIRKPDMG